MIGNDLAQPIQMSNATIIRNGNLAIQNHLRQPRLEQPSERLSEEPCAVLAIAAEQHKLAVPRQHRD